VLWNLSPFFFGELKRRQQHELRSKEKMSGRLLRALQYAKNKGEKSRLV
jgi:hypothetical protein